MADHSFMSRVEVLSVTDTGRRRRWTDAEKLRIVEESYAAPRMGSATARRHEISRTLLTRWRREAREGLLSSERDVAHFSPVTIASHGVDDRSDRGSVDATAVGHHDVDADRAEILMTNGRRLMVKVSIDAHALARLIKIVDRA